MKPAIGLTDASRKAVAAELTKLLADEFLLYTKTLNAHWNVEGPDFHAMHIFFETQYGQLQEIADSVAERIRSIGHYAPATMKSFLSLTHLTEASGAKNTSLGFIGELLADHEAITEFIRGNIDHFADDLHDATTSDFITSIAETHEKMAWMLRAHLK
ncbi:MAG: DNA starvation/stationary phase protection protein [Chitinophagaceae bacterium]